MDWERSKAGKMNLLAPTGIHAILGDMNSVSAWRTCFVANEFNEIQTFRRIHLSFQLFFVLFVLKVKYSRRLETPLKSSFRW